MGPGLLLVWALSRSHRDFQLVICFGGAAVAALAMVLFLYWKREPALFDLLLNAARFRGGLAGADAFSQTNMYVFANLVEVRGGVSRLTQLEAGLKHFYLLGYSGCLMAAGLLALLLASAAIASAGAFVKRDMFRQSISKSALWSLLPWTTMAVLWIGLMSQHFSIHNYQIILLAIPVSVLAGLCASQIHTWMPGRARKVFLAGASVSVLLLVAQRTEQDIYVLTTKFYTEHAELGRELAKESPANATLLVPWLNLVVTWYSKRHIVRGVIDQQQIAMARAQILGQCADCQVYRVEKNTGDETTPVGPGDKILKNGWLLRKLLPWHPTQDNTK